MSTKMKYIVITILISIITLLAIIYLTSQDKIFGNDQAGISPNPAVSESPVSTPVPTPTPTPSPSVTPEPVPTPITATMIAAGDCVIHDDLQKAAKIEGEDRYDFTHMFEEIKPFVESADYGIISYEGAATNNRNDYAGFPYFNCPPELFDAFKYAGFDLVNNANNHQLDRRVKGMLETRENIKNKGLDVIAYNAKEQIYNQRLTVKNRLWLY